MKIKKSIMLLSVLILFLGISIAATTSVTESINKESQASFTGTVVDAETSEPITEAMVKLNELDESVTTDENGGFSFEIEPGDYTLSVEAEGYTNHEAEVSIPQEGKQLEIKLESEL